MGYALSKIFYTHIKSFFGKKYHSITIAQILRLTTCLTDSSMSDTYSKKYHKSIIKYHVFREYLLFLIKSMLTEVLYRTL